MERVVATVPRHCLSLTTAATGLHVGLGMAVAPLPLDAGCWIFLCRWMAVLRHCMLDTVLGFGSMEMGWRLDWTMTRDVRNLLQTKVTR